MTYFYETSSTTPVFSPLSCKWHHIDWLYDEQLAFSVPRGISKAMPSIFYNYWGSMSCNSAWLEISAGFLALDEENNIT
jgi:hypothetical protein